MRARPPYGYRPAIVHIDQTPYHMKGNSLHANSSGDFRAPYAVHADNIFRTSTYLWLNSGVRFINGSPNTQSIQSGCR